MSKYKINNALGNINIAEDLNEGVLTAIASELKEAVEEDDLSRQSWLSDQDSWLKLASQVRETKSYPWQNASNVKYPLMTVASLQFHARALPSLVNSTNPVRARVVGKDPQGIKLKRANRVSKFMSYQVLEAMPEWMDDMDRMMMVLPIIGLCYKKTYYSDNLGRVRSTLVMPRDLILNYHAQDYVRARMSHCFLMDQNEMKEFQNAGIFLDVDINAVWKNMPGTRDETIGLSHTGDSNDDPFDLVESHCWLDLDEDGYKEPYIVTYHRDSGQILRIVARWIENGITYKEDGGVAKITATEYFTPYMFMPDPNSAVYGIGFGRLLGPTNESVNTIINQLIDGGTLSNMQSGYISRGLKLRGGSSRFRPGEWKEVNVSGADLKNGIYPLPVREPSATLFNLLGMLIESGQQISSVTDMMMGENPGQNQPATTSMAVLEQGIKVFNGIYKRVHRSLASEYRKIYTLDGTYLDEEVYNMILDEGVEMPNVDGMPPEQAQAMLQQAQQEQQMVATIDDFLWEGLDIMPTSDPTFISDTQKSVKAEGLLQKAMGGLPINIDVATRKSLEADGYEDIDEIMNIPPQPPSIEEKQFELETIRTQIEASSAYFKNIEHVAKAESLEDGSQLNMYRGIVDDHLKIQGAQQSAQESQQKQQSSASGKV